MSARDLAGAEVELPEWLHLPDEKLREIRSTAAIALATTRIPLSVVAQFFGVSVPTIRDWLGDVQQDDRHLLADPTNEWLQSALGIRTGFRFELLPETAPVFKFRGKKQNFENNSPRRKPSGKPDFLLNSSSENKIVYNTRLPHGDRCREDAIASPDRARAGISRQLASPDFLRVHGGSIIFWRAVKSGTRFPVDVDGLRTVAMVKLRWAGLSARSIGDFLGLSHPAVLARIDKLKPAMRLLYIGSWLDSIWHIPKKGPNTCLAQAFPAISPREKLPARRRGRKGGAKPSGSRR